MADIATVAEELAAEKAPAEMPAPQSAAAEPDAAGGPAVEVAGLIGALDADQRIRAGAERGERTLWVSAACVTFLYVALIAASIMDLGGLSAIEQELHRQERERRGQDANSISVELVPDPDIKSKTEKWQDGANGAPTPNPPQPQQQAALPQEPVEAEPTEQPSEQKPEEKPAEEEAKKEPEKETDEKQHDGGQPSLPDLEAMLDAAANDLSEQVKRHYDRKPRRQQQEQQQQQATYSGGGLKVRGVGASGKSDEFSKSVIEALMKTRPGPVALWGRVLVTFQITQQGDLLYVRVLHSSGNKAMDDAAVNAIHRAKFVKPPPGLPADARTYIIDYIFG
ncbi:MAG: energy transducer TonB [Hyphomicrobium sp.]|jgi:TonB family protein